MIQMLQNGIEKSLEFVANTMTLLITLTIFRISVVRLTRRAVSDCFHVYSVSTYYIGEVLLTLQFNSFKGSLIRVFIKLRGRHEATRIHLLVVLINFLMVEDKWTISVFLYRDVGQG